MRRPDIPFRAPVHNDLQDMLIVQLPGTNPAGWHAPDSGVRRPGPRRFALYHQNWSGERVWNSGIDLDFAPELRETIQGQNGQATMLTTLARVQAPGAAVRPIPISDYTLQTRMTYVGTIDASGRINR